MGFDAAQVNGGIPLNFTNSAAYDQKVARRQEVLAEQAYMPVAQPSPEEAMALQGFYNNCLADINQLRYPCPFPVSIFQGCQPSFGALQGMQDPAFMFMAQNLDPSIMQYVMLQRQQTEMTIMMLFMMQQQMQMQQLLMSVLLQQNSPNRETISQVLGNNGAGSGQAGCAGGPVGGGKTGDVATATGNLVTIQGEQVDSSIAPNLRAMIDAAKQDGVNLQIISGYRSHQEQKALYAQYGPGRAAKPGTSNHEKGLAVDFANSPGAYSWLGKNASRFGLQTNANAGGWEKWHVSPTGR